jgi:hypothetical protein
MDGAMTSVRMTLSKSTFGVTKLRKVK